MEIKNTELVRVLFVTDIDRDRIDEWLGANFNDEEVEVVDRYTGDVIATSGKAVRSPFICPECGCGAAGILTCGGEKKYDHGNNKWCEVAATGGE